MLAVADGIPVGGSGHGRSRPGLIVGPRGREAAAGQQGPIPWDFGDQKKRGGSGRCAMNGREATAHLAAASGTAFLAGYTDVYGLTHFHHLFVSFMSGNTTMLGVALGRGDFAVAGPIVRLVALFVAAAAAGAALDVAAGRHRTTAVSLVVSGLLAAPLLMPAVTGSALVSAMGILNAAPSHVGATSVSLTFVTGTLVRFGQGLGRTLCGRPEGWRWLLHLPMWLSLLAGAVSASVTQGMLGANKLWPLPAMSMLVAGLVRLALWLGGGSSSDTTEARAGSGASGEDDAA